MFYKNLPARGHFRRQILAIRAILIFFCVWAVSYPIFESVPVFAPLAGVLFGLSGLIAPPLQQTAQRWIPRFILILGIPVCLFIVELLNNTNPFLELNPAQCFFNLVWYGMVFGLLALFLGRIRPACVIACLFFAIIGTINHYVLTFRGRVIFPCDVFAWKTALNVAGGFDFTPDITMIQAYLFLVGYLLLVFRCPKQTAPRRPRRCISLGFCAACIIYCSLFFTTDMMKTFGIYSQQWKTQANGFVLNFTVSLQYSMVSEPESYSLEMVDHIISQTQPVSSEDYPQPVHIIAIMNESFSDFSSYDVPLSDDPTPFLHSLTENTIKGTLISPVTGGGTANVEYEFLTGNPLAFLPANSVAYQLYLKDNTPSLVAQLESVGYDTVAYHPYLPSGWNRTSVYDWMGFDRQMFEEDTIDPQYLRGYISDQCDYENLYRLTDEAGENPLFIFNVTMQNHSGYDVPWANLERTIWMDKYMQNRYPEAEQFFSLMRASDNALRNLISHYSQTDVPTMIIFFGDHQPPLNNDFYEELTGTSMDARNTTQVLAQYTTPFFIWTNYDIPEQQDLQLSTWGLGVLAMKTAGIELTGYQQFLSSFMEQIPVLTPAGTITADGAINSPNSTYSDIDLMLLKQQYEILSYNCIFGDAERRDEFFFLPES